MISLNKLNIIINYALIVGIFTLNMTTISSVLIFSLISFLLIINFRQIKINTLEKFILCLFLLPSLAFSFLFEFNQIQLLRFLTIIILILLFPTISFFNLKKRGIILALIIYIFIIQIALLFNFEPIKIFVDNYYPIDINYWDHGNSGEFSSLSKIVGLRFAGYFYNPNSLGLNICLLVFLYLGNIKLYKDYNKTILLTILIISFISIFLSGSRTSLIVFTVTIFIAFYKQFKSYFIPISIFLIIVLSTSLFQFVQELNDARVLSNIFSLFSDKGDSGYAKYFGFYKYFKDYDYSDIIELLALFFGKMGWSYQFDADLGYLLSFFGIFGTVLIFIYLLILFNKSKNELKFLYLIFLASVGGTIIMNFRFCIIALYLISYTYNLKNKRTNLCVE